MEVNSRQIQKIEIQGKPKMLGVSNCKNMRKVFEVVIGQQYKKGNIENEYLVRGLYEQYKKFHREIKVETNLPKLKGRSSLEIIKDIDKWTIITYQKNDDQESQEVKTTATKEELTAMIESIKNLSREMKWIPTRKLAPRFLLKLGITKTPKGVDLFQKDFNTWDLLYSWRSMHNKITRILDAFRDEGIIDYTRSGQTKLLNQNISIQTLLEI